MRASKPLLLIAIGCLLSFAILTAFASRHMPQTTEHLTVVSAAAPIYPPIAVSARATGEVIVEVKIDQSGSVSTAKGLKGHPLMRAASEIAARRWKFAPAGTESGVRTAQLTFVFRIPEKDMPEAEITPVFFPPYKVEVARNSLRIH